MSIFGKIASAIFGTPANASPAPEGGYTGGTAGAAPVAPAASPGAPTAQPAAAAPASVQPSVASSAPVASTAAPAANAMAAVDVSKVLDKITDESDEDLDWRKSIVDLMKLLKLDSSIKSRKELATELKYTGDMGDSASMNVWLHKQVMTKLAANGGVVPKELQH
jgi:Domain of unknown function (DUF3597)